MASPNPPLATSRPPGLRPGERVGPWGVCDGTHDQVGFGGGHRAEPKAGPGASQEQALSSPPGEALSPTAHLTCPPPRGRTASRADSWVAGGEGRGSPRWEQQRPHCSLWSLLSAQRKWRSDKSVPGLEPQGSIFGSREGGRGEREFCCHLETFLVTPSGVQGTNPASSH